MPPQALSCNVYQMGTENLKEMGAGLLPGDLMEALHEMEQDPLVSETLGAHISKEFIEAKKREWEQYRMAVTDWEMNQYLYRI